MNEPWLDWVRRMQAIAQNGLTFTKDPFDKERFESLQVLAAEILAAGSGWEFVRCLDLLSADKGYATPKVDVRGIVFRGDALLLVKERSDGCWTLPGGWADVNASPAENVTREIREETGFETRAVKLMAVYDREKHPHSPPFLQHVYKLFVLCEITGGKATPSIETEAAEFFDEHNLPGLSLTRVTPGQIARCFAYLREPALPTEFD